MNGAKCSPMIGFELSMRSRTEVRRGFLYPARHEGFCDGKAKVIQNVSGEHLASQPIISIRLDVREMVP